MKLDNILEEAKILGSGYYSRVYEREKDPHMVVKATNPTREDGEIMHLDASYIYARELHRTKVWEKNPHFPRIYRFILRKRYSLEWDMDIHYPIVEMERLNEIDKLNKSEVKAMANLYLPREVAEVFHGHPTQITNHLRMLLRRGDVSSIPNKTLREACEYLINLKREYSGWYWNWDLGPANFMFRRTSYGPQLVFTDPLHTDVGSYMDADDFISD